MASPPAPPRRPGRPPAPWSDAPAFGPEAKIKRDAGGGAMASGRWRAGKRARHLVESGQVPGHDGEVGGRLPDVLDPLHEEPVNHLTGNDAASAPKGVLTGNGGERRGGGGERAGPTWVLTMACCRVVSGRLRWAPAFPCSSTR